ncbi:MAG: hypothetical protein OXQ29_11545 [Rhodospirillaceae bacterium]|nr:hypothetical protein [Rhodospirillaceae bacterium]
MTGNQLRSVVVKPAAENEYRRLAGEVPEFEEAKEDLTFTS